LTWHVVSRDVAPDARQGSLPVSHGAERRLPLLEPGQARIVVNGVELDLDGGMLRAPDGKDIPLRPQSLAVLKHLVANANRVVGKDELLDAVWPGIAVTENSLSQCISEIRKVLGDERQAVLKTIARRGYRFDLPAGASPAPIAPPALADPAIVAPRRWRFAAVAAIAVAAVAAISAYVWMPRRDASVPDTLSIAVLPFDNLSDETAQAYLATGFTDDLTTELARVPGLFVVSRNAARVYADTDQPPAAVASALGVRYLLDGSVRRSGDEVRVNAQLIDASTSGELWADRFDGRFTEVFALQDRVVTEIVTALQLELVPGKANLAVSGDTDNPQAYQAYRRAIEARALETPQGTVEALGLLRQALALDAGFGAAAAEMAWLYWDSDDARRQALGITWESLNDRLYESLALAAANPSPRYHQLVGELLVRERRPDAAFDTMLEALLLDPSDPWTYDGLAQSLIFAGRPAEARTHLQTSLRVDPVPNDWRRYQAGMAAFGGGNFGEAVSQLEQIDVQSPSPWAKFFGLHVLVAALAHQERIADAGAALDRLRNVYFEAREGSPNLVVAQQYFVFGNPADAERLLQGLRRAGVPDLPADIVAGSAERLAGPQIANLVLGRRLIGRQLLPEVLPLAATLTAGDGASLTIGTETSVGQAWVQDDFICVAFPRELTHCGAVFRNPGGTPAARNEYTIAFRFSRHEFSVSP
jgi:adenylate cyclase